MVIDDFLACLFNVHYLIFLSMVHEYAYFLWIYLEIGPLKKTEREKSEGKCPGELVRGMCFNILVIKLHSLSFGVNHVKYLLLFFSVLH